MEILAWPSIRVTGWMLIRFAMCLSELPALQRWCTILQKRGYQFENHVGRGRAAGKEKVYRDDLVQGYYSLQQPRNHAAALGHADDRGRGLAVRAVQHFLHAK